MDLSPYRWIVINQSGGKDSQTALRVVCTTADEQGIPKDRLVVSHQCLGRMEWPGTLALVQSQADYYGLELYVSRYRDKDKQEIDLLEYARRRGKWPSNTTRWCTSEFKRGPGGRVITHLSSISPGSVLNVYGFRADESPARKKKPVFAPNTRFSTARRSVWDWLPIHEWTTEQVWSDIKSSGVPYHPAYDKGMTRLSCRFCIFAPRSALILSGRENPELLDEYCALELEMGHTFQNGKSLTDIREHIRLNPTEEINTQDDKWNM